MKISKLLLLMCVVSVCAPAAFAQTAKGIKYVPQAVKGAKSVPYVVSPKVSPAVRMNLAVPVVRPNVAAPAVRPNVWTAVERQVATKVTVEERAARLATNLKKLEEYARTHNNRLPGRFSSSEDRALKRQVGIDMTTLRRNPVYENLFLRRYLELYEMDYKQADRERGFSPAPQKLFGSLERKLNQLEKISHMHGGMIPNSIKQNFRYAEDFDPSHEIFILKDCWKVISEDHPFVQRYNQLIETDEWVRKQEKERAQAEQQQREEQFIQELRAQEQAAQERAWRRVRLQDQSWKVQPEDIVPDPAENAGKAAALSEEQLAFPGNVTTDEYVEQLLRFYNQLDPLGTGTIQ